MISQQLLPTVDGKGRAAAFEIMIRTPAISNLIRTQKVYQIESEIQTGSNKSVPVGNRRRLQSVFPQRFQQNLAPTGGFRTEQYRPAMLLQEIGQLVGGGLVVAVTGQFRGRLYLRLLMHGGIRVVAQFQHRIVAQQLIQLLYRGETFTWRQ